MTDIAFVEIRYRPSDSPGAWVYKKVDPATGVVDLPDVQRGRQYQIEARSVSARGTPSDWVQQTHTVENPALLPLAPLTLTATAVADGVVLDWTEDSMQRANVEYEIQRTTDSAGAPNAGGWAAIGRARGTSYKDPLTDGVKKWYRVRAIDYNDLPSNFSPTASATPKKVEDGADVTRTVGLTENIVPNGFFDLADAAGEVKGWVRGGYNGTTQPMAQVTGYNSWKALQAITGADDFGHMSRCFPVIPGLKYRGRAAARREDSSAATGGIDVLIYFYTRELGDSDIFGSTAEVAARVSSAQIMSWSTDVLNGNTLPPTVRELSITAPAGARFARAYTYHYSGGATRTFNLYSVEMVPFGAADWGATVGAPVGTKVGGQDAVLVGAQQGVVFRETFDQYSSAADFLAAWTAVIADGEIAIVQSTAANAGGKYLGVGNNTGDDDGWFVAKALIPFDPTMLYKIKVRARRQAGSGLAYFGVTGFAADKSTKVAVNGADSYGNQHYVALTGSPMSTGFAEYVGYFKGWSGAGADSARPDPQAPGTLHNSVRYFAPTMILNNSNQPGLSDVDEIIIQAIPGALAAFELADTAQIAPNAVTKTSTVSGSIYGVGTSYGDATSRTLAAPSGKPVQLGVSWTLACNNRRLDYRLLRRQSGYSDVAVETKTATFGNNFDATNGYGLMAFVAVDDAPVPGVAATYVLQARCNTSGSVTMSDINIILIDNKNG